MKWKNLLNGSLLALVIIGVAMRVADAQAAVDKSVERRDGRHDFDWEMGKWDLHVKRLQHPLAKANDWIELNGTVSARKVWDGRANLAEIELDGPKGHVEFLALRLYNPQSHQWSLNFANSQGGTLNVPMVGEFKDGRGEFYDQEEFHGKMILVRLAFTNTSPDAGHSEQAFSEDGGKTWETNWVNQYTRAKENATGEK